MQFYSHIFLPKCFHYIESVLIAEYAFSLMESAGLEFGERTLFPVKKKGKRKRSILHVLTTAAIILSLGSSRQKSAHSQTIYFHVSQGRLHSGRCSFMKFTFHLSIFGFQLNRKQEPLNNALCVRIGLLVLDK